MLLDPRADRRLKRDGFVKLPLITADRAAALRRRFEELRGFDGQGFVSDLVVTDRQYRKEADAVLSEELDSTAASLFVGHEPFLRSFLCKYPGPDSGLYLHQDWMYVDEREGARTYVVWVALQDVDGDNGQLRVLRGSHLIDCPVRGTALITPWLSHQSVIEPRLLSLPLKAGECVVFDNRLVHSSYPNHTEEPRVAAAIGLRPAGEQLVHFRRDDDAHATRYDVDPAFFVSAVPEVLLHRRPDLPVAETVELSLPEVTPEELARLLDRGPLARIDAVERGVRRVGAGLRDAASGARDRAGAARRRLAGRRASRPADAPGPVERLLRGASAARSKVRAAFDDVPTRAAIAVLGTNEAIIRAIGPKHPAVWDPDDFEWNARVKAAYPDIRAEVEALLSGPTEIPHIEDVTGGIPQGNIGPWRSLVLMHQGRWIEWNCERCPRTTEVVRSIPGLTVAGFSVLEAGTHITTHRGPNKGALRHQMGIIVPGAEGDCRIRVGDEMLVWREGECVMFDFTVEHEAWNDSDGTRVLLMLEVITPLPWYLDVPNRLAQRAMSWFPTTRDMARRLAALEPGLVRPPAA